MLTEHPEYAIEFVADHCGISRTHFHSVFKKETGVSPTRWNPTVLKTNDMRKVLFFVSVLLALGAQAQQERRLLTMEEAVLMGGAPVSYPQYSWDMGGSVYNYTWEGKTHHIDARTGKEMGEPMVKLKSAKKDHFKAFTRDGEVWYLDKDSIEHQITSFNQKGIVCRNVRTSHPVSVITMVCSNWADGCLSAVVTVHPSLRLTLTLHVPAFSIGSMVNTIPGLRIRLYGFG